MFRSGLDSLIVLGVGLVSFLVGWHYQKGKEGRR